MPGRRGRSIRPRPARSRAKGRRSRWSPIFCKRPPSNTASCRSARQSELDFKRAYAKAACAAGLTRDQIVGVYAFETGGNGTYDMQAGVSAAAAGRRDLAGHRLQPVAQHQFGLDPGRARRRSAGGAAAKSKRSTGDARSRSSARSRRSSA